MTPCTVMSLAEVDEPTLAEIAKACNVPTSRILSVYGCTPIQRSMIAATRAEVFHFVLSFGPTVDIDRFCEALRQVVLLNPILRTRLVQCDLGIVQVVTSEEHVTDRRSGDLEQYLGDEKTHRLGLGMSLFHTAFVNRDFVATIHHAIMDYWSVTTLLTQDLPAVYYGLPPKPRPDFRKFVAHCIGIDKSAARSFWAPRFKGAPAIFPRVMPGVTPSPIQRPSRKIILKRKGNGKTPSHNSVPPSHIPYFIEAAWALTAAVYAASESVAYGYVLSGRSPTLNGIETTLGPTITEVPVQVTLQRNQTVKWLIQDRATALRQLQTHPTSQYGIADIGAISDAAKIASGFQTLLNIVPVVPKTDHADVKYDRMVWLRGSFALQLVCRFQDDEISVEPRSDPAVICDRLLHRVLNQFEHTIQLLIDAPLDTKLAELPLLNRHDNSEISQWNKIIPQPMEGNCLHELFRAQARVYPEAMAVEAGDGNASYRRLDAISDRLACELQRRSVSPGNTVAIIFEKSLWAIVAILAVMKVGGVCVPIDKHDEHDHKSAILSRTNAKVILTSPKEHTRHTKLAPNVLTVGAESVAEWPVAHDSLRNSSRTVSGDLAYVTFTSGSTGVPKGVLLEHRSLISSLTSYAQQLDWWQPGCRVLQFAPYASSISICEIFGALLFGGCLCIPTEEICNQDISSFVEYARVDWTMMPPAVLRNMTPGDVPGLRSLVSIGEPIDAETSKSWGAVLNFFNCWGACEAAVLSTVATDLVPDYPGNIGRPIGCAIWIVNPRSIHELVPIGGVGELLIEGPGLARGYLKDESRKPTAAVSFISTPPPRWASSFRREGSRFYRTGDLGRYNPDGSISFVGRQTNQVKISSQMVQLEDIESVLASCTEVRDVATLAKISAGRTQLVAMVHLTGPEATAEAAEQRLDTVRTYARSRLPSHSVPTIWLAVRQIPRTASHKLNRASIREWLKKGR